MKIITGSRSQDRQGRRAALTGISLILGIAMSLAACTAQDPSQDNSEGTTAPLVLAINQDKTSWDPATLIDGGPTVLTWQPVFDTLLRYEKDGSSGPNAAEEFSFNDDFTVLTLTLRDGMTFTDGLPVNAEAAKASIEHYRDSAGPGASHLAGTEIEIVDDLTFTVTSPTPNPLLTNSLALSAGALASPASLISDDLDTNPVGSGPYIFNAERSTSGTTLVYERNEDYWNAAAFPRDEIELRVMPEETARINALQSGQINGTALSAASVPQAEQAGLSILSYQANWAGLIIADRDGSIVPAFADVRVRQAINMVFDREAIVKAIWQGKGVAGNQIFNPNSEIYSDELGEEYAYDIEAAKALMADAGYADGFDIDYPEVLGFSSPTTSLVVQQLAEIGIRANVVNVQGQDFIGRYLGAEFPLFYVVFPSGTPLTVMNGYIEPNATWNVFHTEDPELTELLTTVYAQGGEVNETFEEINRFVVDQAWFAPIGYPDAFWAFDDTTSASALIDSGPPLYTFK